MCSSQFLLCPYSKLGPKLNGREEEGSTASLPCPHWRTLVRDRGSPHIPYVSHWCTPTESQKGSCRNTVFINHGLGHYSSLSWAPAWARERTPTYSQDFFCSKPWFWVHPSWLSLLSCFPPPTASTCGLRSHHLKNSTAHLLHSSTAPWGRTPDGGDKVRGHGFYKRFFFN